MSGFIDRCGFGLFLYRAQITLSTNSSSASNSVSTFFLFFLANLMHLKTT